MPDGTGSFLSARTLAEEPNFSGESQRWHVIGSDGVMARETGDPNSDVVAVLPFACMLTVTAKQGDRVKIISPVSGWVPVADSVGYVLLAKGGADVGKRWRYRVVYRKGAIVRHGIELDSPIVFSMPSHSVVEVLERRINDVGLPRLRIAEGWISEVLNPFAWEEGPVVEILRLLQPLRYRVVRLDGALVTRTVELGSSQVKTIGCGHDVLVVAKKFSDRGNRCIPRLQLADGSGWISLRLTKEPREDSAVVEYIGVGEPNLSAMPMPLAPANLEAPPGPVPMPDPPVPEPADETGVTVDLPKIKNGGLTEDDKCPVCITRSQQQEPGNEGATHREERIAGSSFAPRTTALPPTTYKGPPTMAVTDHDALVALYDATDGPNWQDSSDWGTDADLSDWYGVKVNDQGLVVQLHLSCNKIPRGQIPPQLGGLGALKILSFYTNKLDGHIPSDLGNLSALQLLDLSHNQLSGAIPTQFGDLSKLTSLRLSKNQLSGSIPPELGKLAALEELDLSSNQLNDLIPPELGNLEDLSSLRLDVNQLTGTIPEELGKLTALRTLFLNGNNLSGPIPKELGALSELEMLELNDNQLTGSIPAALGALNKLESLSLHNNELAGNPGSLEGARLSRWLEQLKGSRLHRPWAISVVDFLVELWHFLIPIFDDVTDVILLVATFEVFQWTVAAWCSCGLPRVSATEPPWDEAATRRLHRAVDCGRALRVFPIGFVVWKRFSGGTRLKGQVYDFKAPYWRVRYPDGNWEELTRTELQKLVAP
eukprot:g19641.t1